VDESAVRADRFAGGAQERDEVVVDFALNLPHTVEVARCLANSWHSGFRNTTTPVPRLADSFFDIKPGFYLLSLTPDGAHFGTRIPLDHGGSLLRLKSIRARV
jgi:hypothetical protein